MKPLLVCAMLTFAAAGLGPHAKAAVCANGVYRAGCAGPNGAAVVHKPPVAATRPPTVTCAAGVYRAGCAGPNGAVVAKPAPPHCYWSGGVKVCR